MTQARFYHAGCPVCVSAEQTLLNLLAPEVKVEIVHLGEAKSRIGEAERAVCCSGCGAAANWIRDAGLDDEQLAVADHTW